MKVEEVELEGVKLITPQVFKDQRGFFLEVFNQSRYEGAGIDEMFLQDNLSFSKYGTIRGMHFQLGKGQAKLIKVVVGRVFDVFVDLRKDSPTYKKWQGIILDEKDHKQLYLPAGFAHGFCTITAEAYVSYKVSSEYNPKTESGFRYDDPEIGIKWPVVNPIVSERDQLAPNLSELCL